MKTTISKNALDAMIENLSLADYAVNHRKSNDEDSGCYGVSAVILLTSILDSVGTFYCLDNMATSPSRGNNFSSGFKLYDNQVSIDWYHYVGNARCHFEQVYNNYLISTGNNYGITDQKSFVDVLYKVYRCGLVHNSVTNTGYVLSPTKDNMVFKRAGSNTIILNVPQFYIMVKDILKSFQQLHEADIINEVNSLGINNNLPNNYTGVTYEII